MELQNDGSNAVLINPNNPIKDPGKHHFYLLKSFLILVTKRRLRRCANKLCGTQSFGNDDKKWSRRKSSEGKFYWLCQPCSSAYKNNQYCDFCRQIYLDHNESAETDGKNWVECDCCEKWVHIECEIENGFKDLNQQLERADFQYFCLSCRNKKQNLSPKQNENSANCFKKVEPNLTNLTLSSDEKEDVTHDIEEL